MNLVFDLDNTLINRNKAYHFWLEVLLREIQLNFSDWQQIYTKDNWGYCDRKEFYSWLIETYTLDLDVNFLIKKCSLELHQFLEVDSLVLDLLNRLSKNNNLILATNGGVENQLNKIRTSGLLKFFKQDNIFISGAFDSKKPSSDFFNYIEDRFSKNEKTFMIGDDPINDIKGARNVNWQTVWLSYGRKLEVKSDAIIQNIFGLEQVLNTNMNYLNTVIK